MSMNTNTMNRRAINSRANNNTTRRPFSGPDFKLENLPTRNLKPMAAVSRDHATGTTCYAVKDCTSTSTPDSASISHLHHHLHHQTHCPIPLKPDDCPPSCKRGDDTPTTDAAAAATAAGGWLGSPSTSSGTATKVAPNLYLGGAGDAANAILLRKLRIRRILNVACEVQPEVFSQKDGSAKKVGAAFAFKRPRNYDSDSPVSESEGEVEDEQQQQQQQRKQCKQTYLHIQLRDHSDENIAAHFDDALDFIRQGVVQGEPVLVHCRFGVSRSATMVLAYLMQYGLSTATTTPTSTTPTAKMSYEQAFDHVKARRSQVSPNLGFVLALHALEQKLQQQQALESSTISSSHQRTHQSSHQSTHQQSTHQQKDTTTTFSPSRSMTTPISSSTPSPWYQAEHHQLTAATRLFSPRSMHY